MVLNTEPSFNESFNPVSNQLTLQQQVAIQRKFIHESGRIESGIGIGCSPGVKPHWFEPRAFAHAQKLFHTYEVIIRISQFYGLFLLSTEPKVAGPLRATGNNRSVRHLFTRFLSTMIHIGNWFQSDPFDPKSKAYRSVMVVRGYHRQVMVKLNAASRKTQGDELWINQEQMYAASFEFMGLMALFPVQLGFATFTPYDFHCMFHFWRVISYCLGTEDQFNFCAGTDAEILEHCRQHYGEVWLPKLQNLLTETPEATEFFRGMTFGLGRYLPIINFTVFLRYGADFLQLDKEHFPLVTLWEKVAYGLMKVNNNLLNHSVFLNWLYSRINRFVFWVAVQLRKYHETALEKMYGHIEYGLDGGCPFEVPFNYKTASDLNLF